jgi:hypothetical protein
MVVNHEHFRGTFDHYGPIDTVILDTLIPGQYDPSFFCANWYPIWVRGVLGEVVFVQFDLHSQCSQEFCRVFALVSSI